MPHSITVAIPTFNRPNQLAQVLRHVFESDVDGFDEVDVIVVDDGSEISPRSVVENLSPKFPFRATYLYQENSGPAEARNNGFRNSENEIVLFIDDDILVFPDLIKKHYQAHLEMPGSVICGLSPFVVPDPDTPTRTYRYLEQSIQPPLEAGRLIKAKTIASGNISVERKVFADGNVYRSDLQTPAAEEFELENRLNRVGTPIYFALDAKGWHLQPATIEDKAKQEFKYGVGAAEVTLKVPEAAESDHLKEIVRLNGPVHFRMDGFRISFVKIVKATLSFTTVRTVLVLVVGVLERSPLSDKIMFGLYRSVFGISLFAGFRYGLKKFRN